MPRSVKFRFRKTQFASLYRTRGSHEPFLVPLFHHWSRIVVFLRFRSPDCLLFIQMSFSDHLRSLDVEFRVLIDCPFVWTHCQISTIVTTSSVVVLRASLGVIPLFWTFRLRLGMFRNMAKLLVGDAGYCQLSSPCCIGGCNMRVIRQIA